MSNSKDKTRSSDPLDVLFLDSCIQYNEQDQLECLLTNYLLGRQSDNTIPNFNSIVTERPEKMKLLTLVYRSMSLIQAERMDSLLYSLFESVDFNLVNSPENNINKKPYLNYLREFVCDKNGPRAIKLKLKILELDKHITEIGIRPTNHEGTMTGLIGLDFFQFCMMNQSSSQVGYPKITKITLLEWFVEYENSDSLQASFPSDDAYKLHRTRELYNQIPLE